MQGDKTHLNASFRYFNEAYCNFFVCECILNQRNTLFLSPCISLASVLFQKRALLLAATGTVQMNKYERVWVCFEMARVQYKDCGLSEEFLPSLRYSRIGENTGGMELA